MIPLEEILGWEHHEEVNYADGEMVEFWLPPAYVPTHDCFPHPSPDDMLLWLHIHCPTFWCFGGKPTQYWGQVGHTLRPNIEGDTLIQLLERMVRYVHQYREDLHP